MKAAIFCYRLNLFIFCCVASNETKAGVSAPPLF